MRALLLSCALLFPAVVSAQPPRMIKVDIVQKTQFHHAKAKADADRPELPTEVKMRMPLSLVKSFLKTMEESEVKVNGKEKKGFKADELLRLIETSKSGDLLLEITTNKGDLVKITLE